MKKEKVIQDFLLNDVKKGDCVFFTYYNNWMIGSVKRVNVKSVTISFKRLSWIWQGNGKYTSEFINQIIRKPHYQVMVLPERIKFFEKMSMRPDRKDLIWKPI